MSWEYTGPDRLTITTSKTSIYNMMMEAAKRQQGGNAFRYPIIYLDQKWAVYSVRTERYRDEGGDYMGKYIIELVALMEVPEKKKRQPWLSADALHNLKFWGIMFMAMLLVALLAGCGPSEKQRHATHDQQCLSAGFTAEQCAFLWQMAQDIHEAKEDADIATGFAAGAAASSAGGRR